MIKTKLTIDSMGKKTVLAAKAKVSDQNLILFCADRKICASLNSLTVITPEYELFLSPSTPSYLKFFGQLTGLCSKVFCQSFDISSKNFLKTEQLEISAEYLVGEQKTALKLSARLN